MNNVSVNEVNAVTIIDNMVSTIGNTFDIISPRATLNATFDILLNGIALSFFGCQSCMGCTSLFAVAGDTLTITAIPSGGTIPYNITWNGCTSSPDFTISFTVGATCSNITVHVSDTTDTVECRIVIVLFTASMSVGDTLVPDCGTFCVEQNSGATITVDTNVSSPTYQWYACNLPIAGATGQSYEPDTSTIGSTTYNVFIGSTDAAVSILFDSVTITTVAPITASIEATVNGTTQTPACGSTLSVALGDEITLTAFPSPDCSSSYSYQWLLNGSPYSTSQFIVIPTCPPPSPIDNTYSVTVEYCCNPLISSTCSIALNISLPSITASIEATVNGITQSSICGSTLTVILGDVVTLEAFPSPDCSISYSYQWTLNGSPHSTSQFIIIPTCSSGFPTTSVYNVTVSDCCDPLIGSTCSITLGVTHSSITASIEASVNGVTQMPACSSTLTAELGDVVILEAFPSPDCSISYSYQWILNGLPYSTSQFIIIPTCSPSFSTTNVYGVRVSNCCDPLIGSTCSITLGVTHSNITASIEASVNGVTQMPACSSTLTVELGDVVTLEALPSPDCSTSYSYQWTLNGLPYSTSQFIIIPTCSPSFSPTSVYGVRVSNCCDSLIGSTCSITLGITYSNITASIEASVNGVTQMPACSSTLTVDLGDVVTLEALPSPDCSTSYSYQWTLNGLPYSTSQFIVIPTCSPSFSPTSIYSVTVSNCCDSLIGSTCSITLGITYSNITASIEASVNGVTQMPACSSTLTVELGDVVTLEALPSPDCSTSYSYQWTLNGLPYSTSQFIVIPTCSPSFSPTSIYSVTVSNCCDSLIGSTCSITLGITYSNITASIEASVNGVTQMPACNSTLTVDLGDVVTLEALPSPDCSTSYSYQWTLNGLPYSTSQFIIIPTCSPSFPTTSVYGVTVSNCCDSLIGSTCSITLGITYSNITASIEASVNGVTQMPACNSTLTVDLGDVVTLEALPSPDCSISYSYQWTLNGLPYSTSQFIIIPTCSPSFSPTSIYSVTISNCCDSLIGSTCSITLAVTHSNITASIEASVNGVTQMPACSSTLTVDLGDVVTLEAFPSPDCSISYSYQWTLNSLPYSTSQFIIIPTCSPSFPTTSVYGVTVSNCCDSLINSTCSVTLSVPQPGITASIEATVNGTTQTPPCGSTINVNQDDVVTFSALPSSPSCTTNYSYQWLLNGSSYSTSQTIVASTSSTGSNTYSVTVSSCCNPSNSSSCDEILVISPMITIIAIRNGIVDPIIDGSITVNRCDKLYLVAETCDQNVNTVWTLNEKIVSISPLVRVKTNCIGEFVYIVSIVSGSTIISATVTVKIIIPYNVKIETYIDNCYQYCLDCDSTMTICCGDNILLRAISNQNSVYQWFIDDKYVSSNRNIQVYTCHCGIFHYSVYVVSLVDGRKKTCHLTIRVK